MKEGQPEGETENELRKEELIAVLKEATRESEGEGLDVWDDGKDTVGVIVDEPDKEDN